MVSDMPVVTDVSAPASSDPKPGKSAYVPESDSEKSVSHSEKRANSDSEKTVYVKGHFQNGKWVQPYYRRPPRSKK